MDQDRVVVIDDDNDVVVTDDGYHSRTSSAVDTIVIDEQLDDDVIEIEDDPHTFVTRDKNSMLVGSLERLCDKVYKENTLLEKFVKLCLSLEGTDGMLRVINRSLLNTFKSTSADFKKSSDLNDILDSALHALSDDPSHKFSHIKHVCDEFSKHKVKKRVKLTTLSTAVGKVSNESSKLFGYHKNIESGRRKKKLNSVSEGEAIPTISLEDDDEIAMDTGDAQSDNSNKENCNKSAYTRDSHVTSSPQKQNESGSLLVPQRDIEFTVLNELDRIKEIETQIEDYKLRIAELDSLEVSNDSFRSPYIMSEKLKKQVVELYKELCRLAGEQPVKRHEIRLQLSEGQSQGHVRRLEQFLNDNIGEDGDPPFPDFSDVVRCVKQANIEDGLGWSKILIMKQANMLFTQCGRALQRRRQQREWRDLVGRLELKEEELVDPAEHDHDLLARLEENKLIAEAKERDILERFANMEKSLPPLILNPNISADTDSEYEDDLSTKLIIQTPETNSLTDISPNKSQNQECNGVPLNESTSDENIKDSSTLPVDFEAVQIKPDPDEIPKLLEHLGDNYSMSIDIDDPFLIIEISDSDYESDKD